MDNYDLKKIKKHYGERFAKLCRELFPTYLEKEGLLFETIQKLIEPSSSIYEDIEPVKDRFASYVSSCIDFNRKIEMLSTEKTPEELLNEAGYDFYECKTEAEIQSFKKYYARNEELCTFNGGRLSSCRVFFIVKKNYEDYKRKDFLKPQREDDYSLSVLSIQFTKGKQSFCSIKSRYNHAVANPDATLGNDLERLAPGLTDAFSKHYNINLMNKDESSFYLPKYIFANDGKMYKFNLCVQSNERRVFFCENNIIVENGKVHKYNKDNFLIIDNYIIDLKNKTIKDYFDNKYIGEYWQQGSFDFPDTTLHNIKNIKIDTLTENNEKITCISLTPENGVPVEIKTRNNEIISYKNENETTLNNDFLYLNKKCLKVELPNAKSIGKNFLYFNRVLNKINIENAEKIGDNFLFYNEDLTEINLQSAKQIGWYGLCFNDKLYSLRMDNIENIGYSFLNRNQNFRDLTSLIQSYSGDLKNVMSSYYKCVYNKNNNNNNKDEIER